MVCAYERTTQKMPGSVRALLGKVYRRPKLLNKTLLKKDAKNAENSAANRGNFETQISPEAGYAFIRIAMPGEPGMAINISRISPASAQRKDFRKTARPAWW